MLIVSIAAISLGVGMRRRVAMLPMVVAGIVLCWGVYMQAVQLVMYSSVALGLTISRCLIRAGRG